MAKDAKARIDELRKALDKHNYNYYVLNAPEISDYEFDMMMNELIALEKEHPEYADAASPTQRVGSDINTNRGNKTITFQSTLPRGERLA